MTDYIVMIGIITGPFVIAMLGMIFIEHTKMYIKNNI